MAGSLGISRRLLDPDQFLGRKTKRLGLLNELIANACRQGPLARENPEVIATRSSDE